MILVQLGTQKQQFKRLLDYIENSKLKGEILVQAGHTKYKSKKMKIESFITYQEMEECLDRCDLLISHAGTGSIVRALQKNKKVIVCARLSKYGEHADDHQKELVSVFSEAGYILELNEDNNLDDLIKKLKTWKQKPFKSNTEEFIKRLEKKIDLYSIVKKDNKNNIVFVLFFLIFLFMFLIMIFVRGQKKISITENKTLMKIPTFSLNDFLLNDFQSDLESSLSDQFIFGETIKKSYGLLKSYVNVPATKFMLNFVNPDDFIPLGNKIYQLGNSDFLVYHYKTSIDAFKSYLLNRIPDINKISEENPNVSLYLYKVNRDIDIKLSKEIDQIFKENLNTPISYMSSSYINDYDDYKENFYKTDHHWNYKGSYNGYKDIMSMISDEDEIQKYIYEKCFFDIKFNGSKARALGNFSLYDNFCVYIFEFDEYKTYINNNLGAYGKQEDYINGNYSLSQGINYNADYYGGDDGLIKFVFKSNKTKNNLLIIGDSFSNAVNTLIASHFYNTYVVDLRHYEDEVGEKFSINEFIEKNDIDKVLFIGQIYFYTSDEFKLDLE